MTSSFSLHQSSQYPYHSLPRVARVVGVASEAAASESERIQQQVESLLKEELGVKIACEVVAPGQLDAWTELHTQPKPKRFRDER